MPLLVNEIKRNFGSLARSGTRNGNFILDDEAFNSSSLNSSRSNSPTGTNTPTTPTPTTPTTTTTNTPCFTCKLNTQNLVLPLHLPIGLIYDIYRTFVTNQNNEINCTDCTLPWKIEFHPSSPLNNQNNLLFPVQTLIDETSLTSIYFSALKEADHLRSGSARNVMNLSRAEQLQLWESLKAGDFERFWKINQKIISPIQSETRSIPIKFWICQPRQSKLSRLQFPIQVSSQLKTLKQLLESEFTPFFLAENLICLSCHGIRFSLDAVNQISLDELNLAWSYGDNFINLLLVFK